MSRQPDQPPPEVNARRRLLTDRARPEPARLAAGDTDRTTLMKAGPTQRQRSLGWFEPEQPDPAPTTAASAAGEQPRPGPLLQALRRPRRAWPRILPAVTLAIGMVLGFAVGSVRLGAGGEPASPPATRASATRPARAPQTSVVVRPAASSACLETARRGDELVELLISNRRSRAADLLVAYTVASRQCRKDASP